MSFRGLRKVASNPATWFALFLLMASADSALAIPPLVSGDIPTARQGIYELFVGYLLEEKSNVKSHAVPFWELVYGFSDRQEFTLEAPLLVHDAPADSALGFGDVVLGTKYRLLGNPMADSGLSVSLEVKVPTGNRARGLGSDATDVDMRARGGWEVGRGVTYLNLARIIHDFGEKRGHRGAELCYRSGANHLLRTESEGPRWRQTVYRN